MRMPLRPPPGPIRQFVSMTSSLLAKLAVGVARHYYRLALMRHDGVGLSLRSPLALVAFATPALVMIVVTRAATTGPLAGLVAGVIVTAFVFFVMSRPQAAGILVANFVVDVGVWVAATLFDSHSAHASGFTFGVKVIYTVCVLLALESRSHAHQAEDAARERRNDG